jgi:hypothetical protein
MCGKMNPDDREVCRYCQARLTPVWEPPASKDSASPQDMGRIPTGQLPSWLESLRHSDLGETPTPQPTKKESLPDWLNGLRSQAKDEDRSEQSPPSVEPEKAQTSSSDWLRDILSDSEPSESIDQSPSVQDEESVDEADWLSRISTEPPKSSVADSGVTPPATPIDQGDEIPDWLKADAATGPDQTPEEEAPDWLAGARREVTGSSEAGTETAAEAIPAQPGEIPDWIKGPAMQAAAPALQEPEEEIPDWMKGEAAEAPDWLTAQPAAEAEALPAQPGEIPDWIKGPAMQAAAPAPQEPEEEIPDWMKGEAAEAPDWLTAKPAAEAPAEAVAAPGQEQEEEALDWLSDTSSEIPDWLKPAVTGETASVAAGPTDETPDLMAGEPAEGSDWLMASAESAAEPAAEAAIKPEAEALPAQPGDIPEWLKAPAMEAAEPAAQESEEELPDWMKGEASEMPDWLQAEAATPAAASAAAEPPAEAAAGTEAELAPAQPGETAEWLKEPAAGEAPPAAQEPEEEIPDWLKGEAVEVPDWLQAEAAAETPAEPTRARLDEIPEWMKPSVVGAVSSPAPKAEEEIPEWMAGEEGELPGWIMEEIEAAQTGAPPPAAAERPIGEEPDWMASLEMEKAPQEPSPAGADLMGEGMPESDLSWLDEMGAEYRSLPEGDTSAARVPSLPAGAPGGTSGMPDWLVGAAAAEEAAAPEGVREEALKPAELPGWLKAMRPVSAMGVAGGLAGEAEDRQVEGAGPLAGLHDILPAEPDISQTEKPPIYTLKLEIDDEFRAEADLLKSMIDAEGQPQALAGRPIVTPQRVLRILIAAVLAAALLLVRFSGLPEVNLPTNLPEVDSAVQLINNLPANAPVLMAIDYEPGMSGEMDSIAGALLEHLMSRGAYIALVSTRPTGPVQAEHLFAVVEGLSSTLQYEPSVNYANLGFIPGGPVGLQSFAKAPRESSGGAVPSGWDNPPLQGIHSLSDFSMLVVATENPDTVRSWMEQVQPNLNGAPLVMLVSAQAEPMVRPYYHASPSRLYSLVSGVAGGAYYEATTLQSGAASQYWASLSLGMFVAGLLIILGGMANAISGGLARRKEGKGAKPASGGG